MKQIKIKEVILNKENINDCESREITMDNNYMFEIYSIYKGKDIEEVAKNIIKVNLPADKDRAKTLLKNGFEFNGVNYKRLITTVGAMKHEDTELEIKADYFFIHEDDEDFRTKLEEIASLGKLANLEGETIYINKDVVSRLSLLLSSGEFVKFEKPLIYTSLKEARFEFSDNYLQFAEKVNEDGKKVIDLDKFELEKHLNMIVEHTTMDGQGLMMPWVATQIQGQLDIKEEVHMIGFRTLGTACKGSLLSFDWKYYFRHYREFGNDIKIIVKDQWDNEVDIMKVDVIVNESLMKWGKLFDSMEEIEKLKENYPEYKELLNGMCITKINKEPKEFNRLNYQILSNLAITPNILNKLSKKEESTYNKIINKDVDATRIMLGDWTKEGKEGKLNPTIKTHALLQLDEKLINMQSAKYLTDSMLNKKVHELAGGRITVRGWYSGLCNDILSYLDALVDIQYIDNGKAFNVTKSERGLDSDAIYQPREKGIRVLARCPLNSADELVKTEIKPNEHYEKLFGDYSKDLVFLPLNNYMMRMSGADTDFDIAITIDNEDIANAVIEDIDENGTVWHFRNQFDGGSKKDEYNENNLFDCILDNAGNSIGQLSNQGAKISNQIQTLPYKSIYTGDLRTYKEILDKYKDDYKTIDGFKEAFKEGLENEKILDYTKLTDEEIAQFIRNNFQEFKKYSYFTTYMQMVAIDSVKTGINVSPEEKEKVEDFEKIRKPLYIFHAKYKTENRTVDYNEVRWTNTVLNNYCTRINKELGYMARKKKESEYKNDSLFNALVRGNDKVAPNDLINELKDIIDEYNSERRKISKVVSKSYKLKQAFILRSNMRKRKNKMTFVEVETEFKAILSGVAPKTIAALDAKETEVKKLKFIRECLNKITENQTMESIEIKIERAKEKRDLEYTEFDETIHEKVKPIIEKYNKLEILKALYEVRDLEGNRVKSRFVMEFFFEQLYQHLLELNQGLGTIYELTKEGEIEYMNDRYNKKSVEIEEVELTEKDRIKNKIKLGEIVKLRILNLTYAELSKNEITVKDGQVFIEDKKIGDLFKDSMIEGGEYNVYKYDWVTKDNKDYKKARNMSIYIDC